MWFEILSVFILLKFKKRPNISGIRVVCISIDFVVNMFFPGEVVGIVCEIHPGVVYKLYCYAHSIIQCLITSFL